MHSRLTLNRMPEYVASQTEYMRPGYTREWQASRWNVSREHGKIRMSVFVDQLLLQLSDPTQLIQLLAPTTDTNHTRLLTLLKAVYNFQYATIHDVRNITVQQIELQKLLLTTHRTQGTWTQTIPNYTRTDVLYEKSDKLEPLWLNITAQIGLTLLLEVDSGAVESIGIQPIEGFQTLDDFKAHFHFIDLQAFMTEHELTTVDDLRAYAQYLIAQIQLKQPPKFDPNDPANLYSYTLSIAILIRDTIDIAAALQDLRLARAVTERVQSYSRSFDGNEVLSPYGSILIFPQTALTGSPFNQNTLQTFFANQGILALFLTPS